MSKYLFLLLLFFAACNRPEDVHPQVSYAIQDRYLKQLPSPFAPLSSEERREDWGKEYLVAIGFAHELDLYQAMTAFKRAEFLYASDDPYRKLELEYDVFLCYYLGRKYGEAVYTFETTALRTTTPRFPAYEDMLIVLYDCYLQIHENEQAARVLATIQQHYPATAKRLAYSGVLIQGDIPTIRSSYGTEPDIHNLLEKYDAQKKSVTTAQVLNAFIPGAGYFYVGQTQSGVTSVLINGLFIWAAVNFFQHGNIAAGAITTSFEAGWYFGGLYGAAQSAQYYNAQLYERLVTPLMNEKRLFPILTIRHAF